jgi:ubiquinone/menaquinone biosynthesis C-methylase UbiE
MNPWVVLAGVALAGVAIWQVRGEVARHQQRRDGEPSPMPAAHAGHLTNPLRRLVQSPEALLDAAGLAPGMTVLELGPGPGYFTVPAARRVGNAGRVLAVDVQPAMIAMLERRLAQSGLSNAEARIADAHHLPAADASVDAAFLVSVLGEIPEPGRALAELRRVLKPTGSLTIGESRGDPDRLGQVEVMDLCRQAGFQLADSHSTWFWNALNFRPV